MSKKKSLKVSPLRNHPDPGQSHNASFLEQAIITETIDSNFKGISQRNRLLSVPA